MTKEIGVRGNKSHGQEGNGMHHSGGMERPKEGKKDKVRFWKIGPDGMPGTGGSTRLDVFSLGFDGWHETRCHMKNLINTK